MARKKPWRCSSNSGIFHRWDHIFNMELFSTWSADLPYTDIFHLCRFLLIWLIEKPISRYLGLRTKDLQHSCQIVSHSTRQHASHVINYLLFWSLHFTFNCFFFILLYCFFFCFFCSSSSLSPVVCENREEPWPWFQYLWWHQWPGEPLQTFRYGTTRPGPPANHSLPGFTSELPWKLLLVTAVFCLSVCMCVCLWGGSWLG